MCSSDLRISTSSARAASPRAVAFSLMVPLVERPLTCYDEDGAVVTFTGKVRNHNLGDSVNALTKIAMIRFPLSAVSGFDFRQVTFSPKENGICRNALCVRVSCA